MSRWSLVQRTDYANLFGDEGGERSSLARGGRKNWWDGFSTAPTGSNGRASAKTVRRVHAVPATQTAPRQAKTSREAGEA